jgi:hypothetical protein
LKNIRGLVTPPLPFAEAERKAGPNGVEHNTVRGKLPTVEIAVFAADRKECRQAKIWAAKVRHPT